MKRRKLPPAVAVVLGILLLGIVVVLAGYWYVVAQNESLMDGVVPSAGKDELGLVLLDIQTEESATHYHVAEPGVYVLEAEEDTRAYQAGVRAGDRIVAFNGQTVTQSTDMQAMTDAALEESGLQLTVYRDALQETLVFFLPAAATE